MLEIRERCDRDAIEKLKAMEPFLWLNPAFNTSLPGKWQIGAHEAEFRIARNSAVLENLFTDFAATGGRLESPLVRCDGLKDRHLEDGRPADCGSAALGRWWIKRDDLLPVSGSTKTRGAVNEILRLAERLAADHGVKPISDGGGLSITQPLREVFAAHTVVVGSTGNLGLAVGLVASAFGFKVVVYMSKDAKSWKKETLRAAHVRVVEHDGDYASAVAAGREVAIAQPRHHFVDDERSEDLFLGYAAVAAELQNQFDEIGLVVDRDHPLFVYIPCGVGGAPGGICYGLKNRWGVHVHVFFAQACASPALLVHYAGGVERELSVYDIGLSNRTEADGLAVASASKLAAPIIQTLLSGIFTVDDKTLLRDLYLAARTDGIRVEPSAVAALRGPAWICSTPGGRDYIDRHGLGASMENANHIIWSTGGLLVPREEQSRYELKGRLLSQQS